MMNWFKKIDLIDTSKLVKETDYENKISDIEGKIASITGLATTTALNAVENEIPNISDLVKKSDYDNEIQVVKSKYLITSDYNKFTK